MKHPDNKRHFVWTQVWQRHKYNLDIGGKGKDGAVLYTEWWVDGCNACQYTCQFGEELAGGGGSCLILHRWQH